jgi:hypothetical protein
MAENEDFEIEDAEEPEEIVEEVELSPEDMEPELDYDDDAPNLVPVFMSSQKGRDALKKLSEECLQDYDAAMENSEQYRERQAKDWLIFSGDLPPKTFPWENCANAHVPIMLENVTRLVTRAAAELFGDESNVVVAQPVGPDDEKLAQIVTKHTNWQLKEKIPDFFRQQHRGLLMFFMNGDVTCESYYDPRRQTNRHEMLTCDEFITPFVYTSTMPDYSDCPFVCRVLRYYRHDLEAQRGNWYDVDRVIDRVKPSWDDTPEMPQREAAKQQELIDYSASTRAPYTIIQYDGWKLLPRQGRERYVRVLIDKDSKNILRMSIHEEVPWEEKDRLDRQNGELLAYQDAMTQHQQLTQQMQMHSQMQQMMGAPPSNLVPPPPPMPPEWLDEGADRPKPARTRPINMYTHIVCIEPLSGNLGYGLGRIESDFNRAANVALSQFIDAATLANCQAFITSGTIGLDRPLKMAPGAVFTANGVSGNELKNHIMPIGANQANPQLLDLVERMYAWGQSSIQSPDVLSGEPGKSGETFRGIATRVEQATKQLSVLTQKYAAGLSNIVKNNSRLNEVFMPEEEVFYLSDHRGSVEGIRAGRKMYQRGYRYTIRADMKYASDAQRVADADLLVQAATSNPYLMQNAAFNYAALKKSLEVRDLHDMVPLLGPEPPPAQAFALPMAPPMEAPAGNPDGAVGPPPEGQ